MQKGKVYIVGAGPGDVELLTVRAHRVLSKADVVLYDRLVSPGIVALVPKNCEMVPVGKQPGRSSISQDRINELLLDYSRKFRSVVRLKSGNPFVFGRGWEESDFLQSQGVEVSVVPGVSSALAAPALYDIPMTHRGMSQSFVVVTGQEADEANSAFDWEAVVKIDTVVVLMGVGKRMHIAKRLIDLGRDPQDPVAFIENAYHEGQRLVLSTLSEVAENPPEVKSPAVTVIGPVVNLHKAAEENC